MIKLEKLRKFYFGIVIIIMASSHVTLANDNLINTINSQTRKIKELEKKIDKLESNLASLKTEVSRLKMDAKSNQAAKSHNTGAVAQQQSPASNVSAAEAAQAPSSLPATSLAAAAGVGAAGSPTTVLPVAPSLPQAPVVALPKKKQEDPQKVIDDHTEIIGKNRDISIPKTVVNAGRLPKNADDSNGGIEIAPDKKVYDEALMLMKDNRFDEAQQKFSDFIRDYPESSLRDKASFWYAESFYRQGIYNRAAAEYLNSYKAYPKGSKAADSLLKLSYSLNGLNKKQEACNMLEKLDREFPNRSNDLVIRSEDAKARMKCDK